MPTTNKLTDAMCRRAVPGDKAIKLFDGGGLHLYVTPKGAKVWRLAYRLHGKPQQMSLGPYPLLSLADARTKRDEIKRAMLDGADPMAQRRTHRAAVTLQQCARDFLATRGAWSESYRENAERALEMHILPHLGSRPIAGITRDDLLEVLKLIDARGKHVWARKLRMWAGQVWDYAVEHGHAAANVAATIKPAKAFGSKVVEHFPSLELHEVPAFMERLSLEPPLQSVLQCKFLALTWVRTKEARAMRWDQIDGDLWRVPSGTMKKRRPHLVPLSTQALQLLKLLRAMTRSEFVFPAPHRLDRTASENAVLALIARIGYKGRMTGHGFRSVGSTWANENGYSPDAIERQLAHAPDDEVRATYNQAQYLPERRAMLQAYADWLMAPPPQPQPASTDASTPTGSSAPDPAAAGSCA